MDEAISKSFTLKDFDRLMAEMGYRVSFDPNRKYWTIIGKGWQRPKRLYRLGEDYTNDRIMERIKENSYAVKFQSFAKPQAHVRVYRVKGTLKNARKIGGLRGLYLHFIFGLVRAVGMIMLGFGIVQIGLSLKSHDPSQRANGFLTLAGGVVITFAKEILTLITG